MRSLILHREVLLQLVRRDLEQRYRGSMLGIAWAFVLPLMMLGIYTFVFGFVFKQRWGANTSQNAGEFALMLFAGLLVYAFFAECVTRAPMLVVQNPNYVKKVVFPLQWLPAVTVGAALVQMGISLLILALALLLVKGSIPWTFILFPLAIMPLVIFVAACTWLLAALGVFLRDIGQIVGVGVSALMFLSPVFFPISAAPERVQWILKLNPLSLPIEQARDLLIVGRIPAIDGWLVLAVIAVFSAWVGHACFSRLRPHFADVL